MPIFHRHAGGNTVDRKQTAFAPYLFISASEEAVDKFGFVEDLEVVNLFSHSDVPDGDFEFVGDGEDDAAFGCAIELGEGEGGDFGGFGELAGLLDCVLPGGGIEDEEYFVGRCGHDLLHDALDFGELVHEVDFVVEAAGGVDDDDVCFLRYG